MHQVSEYDAHRHKIFFDRYALKRPDGRPIEATPGDMFTRVAQAVARDVEQANRFHGWMREFAFVPGGRILAGAGGKRSATLYNCFVIGLRDLTGSHGCDSRVSIMKMMTRMVEINARGGGVGINWSALRPSGSYIRGVDGQSSGPNGWMRGADALSNQIRQGGSRTAALMFMLDDWHPDAPEFARTRQRFLRANFSIGVSDAFMGALASGGMWHTIFPRLDHIDYDRDWCGSTSVWSGDVVEYDCLPAETMWRDMAESAHAIGSPGVVFIDRCHRASNTWYRGRIVGTNPCGEQPLPEDGCCNLGAVNLAAFWNEVSGGMDMEALRGCVGDAVEFLDRVVDVSPPMDARIDAEQAECRRVGLGTMGLADVLILHGIRYGSDESLGFIDDLYAFIRDCAYERSIALAEELGPAPGYTQQLLDSGFAQTLPQWIRDGIATHGIRNLTLLTQAPTGTTSALAGASSGIEPVFAARYTRTDATGCHVVEHPLFSTPKMAVGDELVTAMEITPLRHVLVQAEVQRYVDASVSKTVNLPESATAEDIAYIFRLAYDLGCKGITAYRDKSGEGVYCEECRL